MSSSREPAPLEERATPLYIALAFVQASISFLEATADLYYGPLVLATLDCPEVGAAYLWERAGLTLQQALHAALTVYEAPPTTRRRTHELVRSLLTILVGRWAGDYAFGPVYGFSETLARIERIPTL
jgi:hypothetical protein